MHFTRLVSSFAAFGAITMLVVAGCSSDDKATPGGGGGADEGGSAGIAGKATTTAKVGGSAGASTTTSSKGGTAGAATTVPVVGGTAGAATTVRTSGGTAGAATTTVPVSGGAAGAATTTTVGGTTGVAGSGNGGTGGVAPTGSTLKDLLGAICKWEFKCCDAGEAKYELGPTVATAAACTSAFTYLLESDNTVKSPYPATLPSLLSVLGYSVDPAKVTENPAGIAQCIAQWNTRACNAPPTKPGAPAHCTGTSYGAIDPCALNNLVKPKQPAGTECNFALNQASSANDIECVAGTSCVDVGDADNPSTAKPTCVTRGVAGAVCTSDKKCDYGFYCDTVTTGACVAKGAPGAVCSYKNEANPVPNELTKQCMPGLSCNPATKTCIEDCKTGFVCNSYDWACPAGQSCIPITVGNVSDKFQTCSAQSTAAAPITRCDSAEDCGAGNYCAATSCKAILAKSDTCADVSGECPAGTYCRTAGTARTCDSYVLNSKACMQAASGITSTECDPVNSIGCVYLWDATLATPAATHVCSATLLANTQRCGNGFDCASGKCEFANSTATFKTCIAGAALNGDCVQIANTIADNKTTCAAGLTCKSGKCVAQVGPGGNCELATAAGQKDDALCKNATCDATLWKDSSAIMCTDAAVPVVNGGTNATCDGV